MPGSHVGLLHNPAALYVIADRLAQPAGVHEPFQRAAVVAFRRPARSVAPTRRGRRREGE